MLLPGLYSGPVLLLSSHRISLRVSTLKPSIIGVETKEGVALSVEGVAQVARWNVASDFYLYSRGPVMRLLYLPR